MSDAKKKNLVSAKNSYDKAVAQNKELKAYIQNIKQRFQEYQEQQQVHFLKKQKNYYEKENETGIKKLFTKKNLIVNPELEEKEYCADEIEEEPEIKKKKQRKRQKKKK